ncbi:hypothetical protein BHY_1186 (plasmid) [Borrelia nietonii YOR]|uniref:Uncharacterized protein n=1 Tax=Borrelia nietonii YOR TaxID=1293576 RepID=W5SB00_9SPIR|nr:hypothetical protein BHY_1186 [Borrelia nietonii YOR]
MQETRAKRGINKPAKNEYNKDLVFQNILLIFKVKQIY